MFTTGDKAVYNGKSVIVLTADNDEVLIFLERDFVKWVKSELIEVHKAA